MKVTERAPLELTPSVMVVLAILLAALRLSELIPITRSPGGSSQNWRLEVYVSAFLVICSVWIVKNRSAAAAKLAEFDKMMRIITAFMIGFAIWGAFSAAWADSWAPVFLHTLSWIAFISVFVFSLVLFRTRNGFSAMYAGFYIAAVITAILSLFDFYQVTDAVRDMGPIRVKYARTAESFLTLSPILCVGAIYAKRRPLFIAAIVGWLLSWLVVMLSTSKGAFLAGIIGHFVLFAGCALFVKYPIRRKTALLAGLWLAFTVATQIAHGALSPLPTTTDFLSGEADPTRETSTMRIFTWQIGLKMAAGNPLIGVGANNFGVNFNATRKEYFKTHTEPSEELAEYFFPERAHNEFLQIVAELGVVGGLLFAGIFVGFMILVFRNIRSKKNTISPLLWAAIASMVGFFASSFVSSFSFRIIQNGIIFFIVFALATAEVCKDQRRGESLTLKWSRPLLAFSIIGSIVALVFFGMRGYADIQVRKADSISPVTKAMPYYASAAFFDPENYNLPGILAFRYAKEGQYVAAAASYRKMIDQGAATTLDYSILAEYLAIEGQNKAANEVLAEAISIYPNSVFMRVRYAVFREERSQQAEADLNMAHARLVNAKQANGWYRLLKGDAAKFIADEEAELEDNLLPIKARRYFQSRRENKEAGQDVKRFSY